LTHDLEQRDAGAVEVDEAEWFSVEVDQLAGVLLEVDAGEADAARAVVAVDLEVAAGGQRRVALRDLIALREVGVEVVLAGPRAARRDGGAEGEGEAQAVLDGAARGDGELAGEAEGVRVGEAVGAAG
jgi:hypothetical protein